MGFIEILSLFLEKETLDKLENQESAKRKKSVGPSRYLYIFEFSQKMFRKTGHELSIHLKEFCINGHKNIVVNIYDFFLHAQKQYLSVCFTFS